MNMANARRARKPDRTTTIRVAADTKQLLESMVQPGQSFDDVVLSLAQKVGPNPPPQIPILPRGMMEIDISEELEPIEERLRALEMGIPAGAVILSDPQTGVLFNAMSAPTGNGSEGVNGEPIQAPKDGASFAEERQVFLGGTPEPAGFWVRCPSGVYLTERDGTLPDMVEEELRSREKEAKRAARVKGGQ